MSERIEVACDHNGTQFAADPAGELKCLREQASLVHSSCYDGFWMALTYDLVASAARDSDSFSAARDVHGKDALSMVIPLSFETEPLTPIELDPPAHTPYRRMLTSMLSRTAIDRDLSPVLDGITDYCIDRFIERGEADLILDLAGPVPTLLTLIWLGIPADEWTRVARTQHNIVGFHPESPEFAAAIGDIPWQDQLITDTIAARRAQPRNDAISFLLAQDADGEPLSDKTVHEMVSLLIAGGVDTTTALLGQAFVYLESHPEAHRRMIDDPTFAGLATDEFLRYFTPNTAHARTVSKPVDIGGHQLDRGERILLCWLAANRDPAVFDRPDDIILDREPNRHAAFGLSVHRCAGSNLARLEIQTVIRKLLQRVPDYTIDHERAHRYPSQGATSGWSILPITFTPGARLGDGHLPGGEA